MTTKDRKSKEATLQHESMDLDKSRMTANAVAAILKSKSALSFYSSAIFHLSIWTSAFLFCKFFGLYEGPLPGPSQANVQASLGEADVLDDAANFEFVGEIGLKLELPTTGLNEIGQQLRASDLAGLSRASSDVFGPSQAANGSGEQGGGTGVLLRVPASGLAVTKGSFTAFTIPAKPLPHESYSIVVEIRLTSNVRQYRVSDLSGEVRGSDNYVQKLPFDPRSPLASGYPAENKKVKPLTSSTVLEVVDNRVQIVIRVPGAARLVRDEIRIRSKRLREEQVLTLIFNETIEPSVEEKSDGDNTE
jgi:hypothetical protein